MDIQSIRKIFFPVINDAINQMEDQNLKCNITLLKRIVNEAIDGSLNRSHSNLSNIIADFAGRGRAWAKVNVNENNPVWVSIKESLLQEMNSSDANSEMYMRASGLLDLFENTGIAWMRFAGVNNKSKNIRFQLRLWGSKIEDHIKIYIHECDYSFIENLEGVPHNLNLESGNFILDEINKKEKINIDISPDELSNLGIQTLEDILGENFNNEKQ
jgi:hypothetical protein